MDLIFSNPGYHHIAQNICKFLSLGSLTILSRTSKNLLEHSNEAWLKRLQNYQTIQKVYKIAEQKFAKSMLVIDVKSLIKFLLHELDSDVLAYILIPKLMKRSTEYDILLKLLIEILEFIAKDGMKQIYDIAEIKDQLKNDTSLTEHEKHVSEITLQICKHLLNRDISVLKVYGSYVPSQVPSTLRPHLMTILSFAIQKESLDLVLLLLKPLIEYDTCISTMILALATPHYRLLYDEEMWDIKNVEELNDFNLHYDKIDQLKHAEVVRMIAEECKNPNTLNNFGATPIYMAAKFGLFEIVKVLLPLCKNLDAVNRDQNTILQLAEESGHHKIVKLLTQMKLSK